MGHEWPPSGRDGTSLRGPAAGSAPYNCRMPVLLAYSTCPDAASADSIARTLVEERLAACVNRIPGVQSTYRWQGQIEQSDEVLLLIKTTADRLEAMTERLRALHPYELPELVAVEIRSGLPAYLAWIAAETAPSATPDSRIE